MTRERTDAQLDLLVKPTPVYVPKQKNTWRKPEPEEMRARHTDPSTSHEAAESITADRVSDLRRKILNVLTLGPMTTEEIHEATDIPLVSVSPTMKPMEKLGLVYRAGKRPNRSGRNAITWAAV